VIKIAFQSTVEHRKPRAGLDGTCFYNEILALLVLLSRVKVIEPHVDVRHSYQMGEI